MFKSAKIGVALVAAGLTSGCYATASDTKASVR
ncbi:MAG: hypothetical protein ACI9HX_001287 [Pseudoalteromonas tetraodonis]|jgi:hypothetical protein